MALDHCGSASTAAAIIARNCALLACRLYPLTAAAMRALALAHIAAPIGCALPFALSICAAPRRAGGTLRAGAYIALIVALLSCALAAPSQTRRNSRRRPFIEGDQTANGSGVNMAA